MKTTRLGQVWGTGWRRLTSVGSLKLFTGKSAPSHGGGAVKFLTVAVLTVALLSGPACNTSRLSSDKLGVSGDRLEGRIKPVSSDASRCLSNARYFRLMGRQEAALKELEEAHRLDPDNLKIVDTLAQNYQELGQYQRVQELYQEALSRQGSNRALNNNWCFSFYLQGNLSKAESCFKEALARDPGNIAARNNLGLLWCRQGKLAEARQLWEEAEGAIAAQSRVDQAIAFLGGSSPANYAKLPEPGPKTQVAAAPKPVVPVTPAASPKAPEVKAPTPMKVATATPPAAAPVKAEVKEAAKPAAPKPGPQTQVAAAPKPVVPVTPAVSPKAPEVKAPTPMKVATPTPPAVIPVKAEVKEAAKPAAPKPGPQTQVAAAPKPAVPVTPAVSPKAPEVKAPTPAKVANPAPPAAAPVKTALKETAKPAVSPALVTAQEKQLSAIEVRNGTRTQKLARQTRARLSQEGFKVTQIGNHIDFGAESTVIYYRPGAEKVAQALNSEIFPGAKMEQSARLQKGVAIKVLLGHDLLNQPQTMARSSKKEVETSLPTAGKAEPGPQPRVEASKEATPPAKLAAAAAAIKPKIEAKANPVRQAKTGTSKGHLTAEELISTNIEIRNGTRVQNLAHQVRSLLSQEGFTVAMIGNHIDFGAEYTIIYYLAGAEKVARALNSEIFIGARLTPSTKLNNGMAIKVVLGRDWVDRPEVMSRLAAR